MVYNLQKLLAHNKMPLGPMDRKTQNFAFQDLYPIQNAYSYIELRCSYQAMICSHVEILSWP